MSKTFDELDKEYYETFGEPYCIDFVDGRPMEYHIERIERAISTNTPCKVEKQEYPKGAIV